MVLYHCSPVKYLKSLLPLNLPHPNPSPKERGQKPLPTVVSLILINFFQTIMVPYFHLKLNILTDRFNILANV